MNENNTVRPILIFCLLIIANWSFGQSVIFDSQAEVDAFDPTTEIIIGDLFIGSK